MKLISLNVSMPEVVEYKGYEINTGIFKEPVAGRRRVSALNIEGDAQADLTVHGGVHKAVYAYPSEHYPTWKSELARDDFAYGQFGENLTVEGMTEGTVHIGDRFRIGTALLEVSQPRQPCYKLAMKMDMPTFPKLFLRSARVGFYLRVIDEGEIGAGDTIERVKEGEGRMSVADTSNILHFERDDVDRVRKLAALEALAPSWRAEFVEILERTENKG